MGYAADRVTLQSRTLNESKGAAVRSKRVQADRRAYSALMKHIIENTPRLSLIQAEVTEIITENDEKGDPRLVGVRTSPLGDFPCRAPCCRPGPISAGSPTSGTSAGAPVRTIPSPPRG